MIAIVLLITGIAAALVPFSPVLFELVTIALLVVPIEAFLVGTFIPPSPLLYGSLILLNIGIIYLTVPRRRDAARFSDVVPIAVWCAVFIAALSFCHRWPDFMSMGERLRDYALLAEAMKSPFTANEPWMTGANLNYYLYWYRFGSFIGTLCGLPVWEMYHILQSLTFSLYVAAVFRIVNRLAGFSPWNSLLCALIVGFGSNIQGIIHFNKGDENWWGPSRVITGAINEFPAWSFLLGDLHPHYLNLALIPLLILYIHALWNDTSPGNGIIRTAALCLMAGPLWIFNANAWEVPVLGILVGAMIAIGFFLHRERISFGELRRTIDLKRIAPFIGICVIAAISLYLSSRNITTGGDRFRFVRPPIAVTTVPELMLHWGFPLLLIAVATIGLFSDRYMRVIAALSLGASLLTAPAVVGISLLITLNLIRVFVFERDHRPSALIWESIGILSLALLFLPEVVFLDDPYGGENERMNTIFKAYSADWAPLHLYAFYLIARLWERIPLARPARAGVPVAALIVAVYATLGFFSLTQQLRRSTDFHLSPVTQGLSQLDSKHPGAGRALQQFAALPDGVTVEAQGNAYSMTTHVATLGGKRSYLGWINHVDLLTRRYDETKRRSEVTDTIYQSGSCDATSSILRAEGIRYLVFGPLERERYPAAAPEQFTCLRKIIEEEQYLIYELPGSPE